MRMLSVQMTMNDLAWFRKQSPESGRLMRVLTSRKSTMTWLSSLFIRHYAGQCNRNNADTAAAAAAAVAAMLLITFPKGPTLQLLQGAPKKVTPSKNSISLEL